MTAAQMYDRVLEGIDKPEAPHLTDAEISNRLTDAQLEFVRWADQYSEANQDFIDMIMTLFVEESSLSLDTGLYWDLPADYFITKRVDVDTVLLDCNNKALSKMHSGLVRHNNWGQVRRDPDSRPTGEFPKHSFSGSGTNTRRIKVDAGSDTVSAVYLTYLKTPGQIIYDSGGPDTDSILPPDFHDVIVAICVRGILENAEQPRYSTYLNEIMNKKV